MALTNLQKKDGRSAIFPCHATHPCNPDTVCSDSVVHQSLRDRRCQRSGCRTHGHPTASAARSAKASCAGYNRSLANRDCFLLRGILRGQKDGGWLADESSGYQRCKSDAAARNHCESDRFEHAQKCGCEDRGPRPLREWPHCGSVARHGAQDRHHQSPRAGEGPSHASGGAPPRTARETDS